MGYRNSNIFSRLSYWFANSVIFAAQKNGGKIPESALLDGTLYENET